MLERPILITGSALRDEFSCPITRELMRDPVIAADGHTYDREAIEMWLRNHDTSPKTGQPMVQLSLVPNLNLRRLIKDLLNEGGEGLYLHYVDNDGGQDTGHGQGQRHDLQGDSGRQARWGGRGGTETEDSRREYQFALVAEQILVLKCLGPTDSDWNEKSFRVTERGAVGGRKQPAHLEGADFMQFSDATVSRRHFGITFDKEEKRFSLRDFGSAGGTFMRLPTGVPTPLYPGMMIMLGKHQLEVTPAEAYESITTSTEDKGSAMAVASCGEFACGAMAVRRVEGSVDGIPHGANVKEGAATDQEEGGGGQNRGRSNNMSWDKGYKLEEALSGLRISNVVCVDSAGAVESHASGAAAADQDGGVEPRVRQDSSRSPLPHRDGLGGEDDASVQDTPLQEKNGNGEEGDGQSQGEKGSKTAENSFEAGFKLARGHSMVCLKCFAPEGTPIQDCRFFVGKGGATLGRKQTNTIAFSHEANGTVMGIDASISGEHARISYDEGADCLQIMDGTPSKPSTNGTWFRLSGMHRESRPYPLANGAEILVGTVRFSVTLETMVVEKELTPENRDRYLALAGKAKGASIRSCSSRISSQNATGRGLRR